LTGYFERLTFSTKSLLHCTGENTAAEVTHWSLPLPVPDRYSVRPSYPGNLLLKIKVDYHEGEPVGITLPKTVDLQVMDTPPGMKSATVTNELKPATTETGLIVRVPNFIDVGEAIRVDTETGEYVSRAK